MVVPWIFILLPAVSKVLRNLWRAVELANSVQGRWHLASAIASNSQKARGHVIV